MTHLKEERLKPQRSSFATEGEALKLLSNHKIEEELDRFKFIEEVKPKEKEISTHDFDD